MRVRVATDALPMWGSSTVRGAASEPGMHFGLAFEDVDAGREDRAGLERAGERFLVHDRTASGVHEHRGRLHARELGCADEMPGRVVERDVQAHDIRLGEERVEVADPAGHAGVGAGVVQTFIPKPVARRATA